LSSADILQTRDDSSDGDVCTFWCKIILIFQNLWCVRKNKGGSASVNKEINFSCFCMDVFYGQPQTTNLKQYEISDYLSFSYFSDNFVGKMFCFGKNDYSGGKSVQAVTTK